MSTTTNDSYDTGGTTLEPVASSESMIDSDCLSKTSSGMLAARASA
jgi:hypothetical protein